MARQVLENGVILPAEYSDDWYDDMTSNLTKLDDVIGSDSEKLSSADVGAAALSNNYNDLDNLPTIPTVNDATLTIQKNGVDVQTFTANASSNVTCNITVPTKTSDLTNDSNFVDTSNSAVASGITSAKVTSYDSHVADTDIHVTTADKTKWDTIALVKQLRLVNIQVGSSTTIAFANIDDTNGIKVGDKCMDLDAKMFEITAVDATNQTVTVGSALIDLALDANVVHTSGNETVGGVKTFSEIVTAKVNNLTPSSLSMPDLSNSIDISSYITDLAGNPNVYSTPANGYIVLRSTTANVLGIVENTTGMGSYSRGTNQVLAVNMPVVKGSSITIYAICSSLTHAKFIPCQGNV